MISGGDELLQLTPWQETDTRFGFEVGGLFDYGLPTLISPGGPGGGASLRFFWSDRSHESFFIDATYLYNDLTLKLFSDPYSDGGGFEANAHTFRLGYGRRTRTSRWTTGEGHIQGSVVSESTPYIGGGSLSAPSRSETIYGEDGEEELPGGESSIFAIGSRTAFGLELRPVAGSRFQLTMPPYLDLGYRLATDNSKLSSMVLDVGIMLYFGYGDNALNGNRTLTLNDHLFGSYSVGHRILSRYISDRVMNSDNEIVGDSGLLGNGDDPNSPTEQVRMFASVSSFSAGTAGNTTMDGFMNSNGPIRWLYLGLDGISGIGTAALSDSDSTMGMAAGDFLRMPNMLMYTAYDLDTDAGRAIRGDDLPEYMAYANGWRSLINTGFFALGLALGDSSAGHILSDAGMHGLLTQASNPAPGTDLAQVSYNFIYSGYWGDHNGARAGLAIDVSWKDPDWLWTQARILTHGATPSNIETRFSEDEPYDYTLVPSSVEVTLGAQYNSDYFRFGCGPDFARHQGGDAFAAIGGACRVMGRIPIANLFAITAGGLGSARVRIPTGDGEYQVGLQVGFELP